MRIRIKKISIVHFIISFFITLYLILCFFNPQVGHPRNVVDTPVNDTAFGGLFAAPHPNDSLPFYVYRQLEDSIRQRVVKKKNANWGETPTGGSWTFFGAYGVEKEFTAGEISSNPGDEPDSRYYFALNGYKLNEDTKFFMENGTYNLAYPRWDSEIKDNDGDGYKKGHYERKQIPVRYQADREELLFPASHRLYKVVNFLVENGSWCCLFLGIYFFLFLPIKILMNVADGYPFNEKNNRRFNKITWAITALALIKIFIPLLLGFFLRSVIPDDFTGPSFYQLLKDNVGLFFIALAAYLTGLAFKKGNKIQEEQDLTI